MGQPFEAVSGKHLWKGELMKSPARHLKPKTWRVVLATGKVTFVEIIRDKILYNSLIAGVFLLGVSYLASRLALTRPERVVLDFGLSVTNLACSMIAIFIGSPLLGKEFERRTIFMALSKPISRFQYLFGKYFGLIGVLIVNWILLSAVYLAIYAVIGGKISGVQIWALILVLIQSAVLAMIALMFSTVSTATIAAMFSLGLYFLGNNISQIRFVALKADSAAAKHLLDFLAVVIPNLEYFNLGTRVSYGLPVGLYESIASVSYGAVLIAALLFFSGWLFERKEI